MSEYTPLEIKVLDLIKEILIEGADVDGYPDLSGRLQELYEDAQDEIRMEGLWDAACPVTRPRTR
jgi:hypothetical protein